MSHGIWKTIDASVRGTDHERSDLPCQDFSCTYVQPTAEGDVLIVTCSDGAGSATYAQEGARFVCQTIVTLVSDHLASGVPLASVDHEFVLDVLKRTRDGLQELAEVQQSSIGQFACTCLFAFVGPESSLWAQVGDGAMVVNAPADQCEVVFWPQHGEYVNTTTFITSANWEERLEIKIFHERIDELALLTDGLQMLALSFAERRAHTPFFSPMFKVLREIEEPTELVPQLKAFLGSKNVNQRTNDDKTLVLATRLSSCV